MSLHRRRTPGVAWPRRVLGQWRTIVWLTVIWLLLWADVSWANLIAGILIAVTVIVLMPLPDIALHGTFRLRPFLVLVGHFVADLVVASAQVSLLALRFGSTPRGGVVAVRLRNASDIYLTATAELSSLVPGSIVVEAHRLTGMLYLHVLDLDMAGGAEKVREDTLALEARVLRAFAPADDLQTLGLSTSRRQDDGVGHSRRGHGESDDRTEATS